MPIMSTRDYFEQQDSSLHTTTPTQHLHVPELPAPLFSLCLRGYLIDSLRDDDISALLSTNNSLVNTTTATYENEAGVFADLDQEISEFFAII